MTPLFAQKQSGDRAFERLYKAYVQDVYRYALMVLRNKADAEDIAQTTFLKAYRAFQRGERPRHARPWLIAIAHNTCRSHMRDGSRRPQEVELADQVATAVQTKTDDAVDAKELVRALGSLSFNQRSALVMRELEGRSYAEIAQVLEVSSSAVETLLFRARRAVREQLEGELGCGDAERALSLQLDGRLPSADKSKLRAHLRECKECATLARRQRARQAVLRGLGPLPLPASLTSWGGGTVGIGLGAKAAAVLIAGVAAAGTGLNAAEAVPEAAAHDRSTATVAVAAAGAPSAAAPSAAAPGVRRKTVVRVRGTQTKRVSSAKRAGHTAVAVAPAGPSHARRPSPKAAGPTTAAPADATETVAIPKLPIDVPAESPVALPGLPPVPVEVPVAVPVVPAAPPLPATPTPTVPLPEVPQLPSLP